MKAKLPRFINYPTNALNLYVNILALVVVANGNTGKLVGSCGPVKGIDTVPLVIALRLAWQEYAGQHPERLEGYAIDQVLLAYEARWPCAD